MRTSRLPLVILKNGNNSRITQTRSPVDNARSVFQRPQAAHGARGGTRELVAISRLPEASLASAYSLMGPFTVAGTFTRQESGVAPGLARSRMTSPRS